MSEVVTFAQITELVWLEQTLQEAGLDAVQSALLQALDNAGLSSDEEGVVQRILEALRLERDWLQRYPETLFQTLWNCCWWLDCPAAAEFYLTAVDASDGWGGRGAPWERQTTQPLYRILERWREQKEAACPGFVWLRTLRPPAVPLGYGPVSRMQIPHRHSVTCLSFDEREQRLHVEISPWVDAAATEAPIATALALDLATGAQANATCIGRRDDIDPEGRGIARTYPSLGIFAPAEPADAVSELLLAIDTSGYFDDDLSPGRLAFSPDGRYLALYGWIWDYDGAFVLWEVSWSTGWLRRKPPTPSLRLLSTGHLDYEPDCMAFSSDSRLLGFGIRDRVALFDVAKQAMVWEHHGFEGSASALAFSAEGQLFARVTDNQQVTIWNRERMAATPRRMGLGARIGHVQFSPRGTRLYTQPWLWDGDTGKPIQRLQDGVGEYLEGGPPKNACYLTDDTLIRAERGLSMWDARTGLPIRSFDVGPIYHRTTVAYAPDGSKIALYNETSLQVLALDECTQLFAWELPDALAGPVLTFTRGPSLAFTQDGRRLLLGLEAPHHGIFVFDIETGQPELVFAGHHARVTGIAVSPDHEVVASSGLDESLILWRLHTGEVVAERPLDEREQSYGIYQFDEEGNELGIRQVRDWQPTGDALVELDGWEGFRWLATRHKWHTKMRDDGVFCVCLPDGEEAAWFPLPMRPLRHPSGRIWATDKAHFVLEGDPFVRRRAQIAALQAEHLEDVLF